MVAERSTSPEPEATVINEREGGGSLPGGNLRPSAADPWPPIGPGSGSSSGGGLRRIRAVSFEASSLVDNFSSYKATAAPLSRVLYYRGRQGAWADFSGEALASLRRAFEEGRTSVELLGCAVGGGGELSSPSIVDFLRMLQTDLGSGLERSVAWIDVHGRCFFPKRVVGGGGAEEGGWVPRAPHMLEIDVVPRLPSPPTTYPSPPPSANAAAAYGSQLEEQSGETTATVDVYSAAPTNPALNGKFDTGALTSRRWDGIDAVQAVDRSTDYFHHVERMFLSGMRRVSPDAAVVAVRRCTHAGAHGGARLRAFVAQAQFTKAVRDDADGANVRAAWYPAATPDEVDGIITYGFGKTNADRFHEDRRYGSGVYLIPPQAMHLHPSYVLPNPDINGERHLLLCRTIAGSMERVELGSHQSHPTADRFDTGADDPLNPRLHVIWGTKMNTHIIPECVVSFRCSAVVGPQQPALTRKPVPARSSWNTIPLTFLHLYAEIRKFVPPATMRTLDVLLEQYKARKIPRDAFIRHIRSVAGTRVLAETIKKFRKNL